MSTSTKSFNSTVFEFFLTLWLIGAHCCSGCCFGLCLNILIIRLHWKVWILRLLPGLNCYHHNVFTNQSISVAELRKFPRPSRGDFVPVTNPIVWTLDFHKKSCRRDEILSPRHVPWIQISLNWGDMSRRQNNVTPRLNARSPRVNCSCDMSPRHFGKYTNQKTKSRPSVWTAHEILPRDTCEPTLKLNAVTFIIQHWVNSLCQL